MNCWKLKVVEYEHGEDESITKYYATRELAIQHGFEIIKSVLLKVACWADILEKDVLIDALKEAEETFYLVTSTYHEITEIERKSLEYTYFNDNNLDITLKRIIIIDE